MHGPFQALFFSDPHRCYDYFFWIPIVAPLVGGVLGSFIYLVFIQWHLPELEDESESEEIKEETKAMENNSKKDELYLKMSSI